MWFRQDMQRNSLGAADEHWTVAGPLASNADDVKVETFGNSTCLGSFTRIRFQKAIIEKTTESGHIGWPSAPVWIYGIVGPHARQARPVGAAGEERKAPLRELSGFYWCREVRVPHAGVGQFLPPGQSR